MNSSRNRSRREFLMKSLGSACLAPGVFFAGTEWPTMPSPVHPGQHEHGRVPIGRQLSSTGIRHLHETVAGYVQRGEVPGLTTCLARRDEVNVDALGTRTIDAGDQPVRRNTIFRIASMSKAITAAAALILVEEGKFKLDDPVDHFLPELANRKVLKKIDGPIDDTVSAKRAITVRDLLTFRLGTGLLLADPAKHPIVAKMYDLHVGVTPFPVQMQLTPDEWTKNLGSLPLIYQPGESWLYHTGSDILGVLIARASGCALETFFRERIFEPLGMKDTAFSVPPNKLDRFVACYSLNPETKKLDVTDPIEGQWSHPPKFPSGGGGLTSTVDDYLAFARMLLNKGQAGKKRLVSAASIEMMTTNQITVEQQEMGRLILGPNTGWGFGVSVLVKPDGFSTHPGRYGWNGGLGSSWWNDPNEGLIAIILTERAFESADPPSVIKDFWRSAYQAVQH